MVTENRRGLGLRTAKMSRLALALASGLLIAPVSKSLQRGKREMGQKIKKGTSLPIAP